MGRELPPLAERRFQIGDRVTASIHGKTYLGKIYAYEDGRYLSKDRTEERGMRYPVQGTGWVYHVELSGGRFTEESRIVLREEDLRLCLQ